MDRAKYQTTAPADESRGMEMENPRAHYHNPKARAKGRSGKGVVREAKKRHAKRA
jgi:hypothetical protein